jgi:hypothetical protein
MGFFIIVGIIFLFGYYLSIKVYPFTKCKYCDGRGRFSAPAPYSYAWGRCRKCGGTGRKDRLGARLFTHRDGDGS